MIAHTPAPWTIIPQHQAGPMIAHEYETGNQMNPKGLRLICHVLQRKDSLATDVDNARLIAAAPKLLATLRELYGRLTVLAENSTGVCGLHLNGDIASWGSLLSGGQFDEWIGQSVDAARALIDSLDANS